MMIKNIRIAIALTLFMIFLFAYAQDCSADSVLIKGVTKMHRMGGYAIVINYETRGRLTDGLIFRIHCKFEKGDLAFASNSLNDIKKGLHRAQINISKETRKRYGSLREYKVGVYKNGILTVSRTSY